MIDTSLNSTSSFSTAYNQRALSAENNVLQRENTRLQDQVRDLRTEKRQLENNNDDLQQQVASLQQDVFRAHQGNTRPAPPAAAVRCSTSTPDPFRHFP